MVGIVCASCYYHVDRHSADMNPSFPAINRDREAAPVVSCLSFDEDLQEPSQNWGEIIC